MGKDLRRPPDGRDLESRAAYLGGLAKGLDLPGGSEEGRVLAQLIDLVAELAREVGRLRAAGRGSRPPAARADDPDNPLFLACECPECGTEIFVRADLMSDGLRERDSAAPAPRDFEAVCPNCGNMLFVREEPPSDHSQKPTSPRPPRRPEQPAH